jgi:hypothetical protein
MFATASVQAGVVTSAVGSNDVTGLAHGNAFFVGDIARGNGLGQWHAGGFSTRLNAQWTGKVAAAHLEVLNGGWGLGGQAELYLNGKLVGLLSDGDHSTRGENYAALDSFDLSGSLGLLAADNLLEVRPRSVGDAGVVSQAKLVLEMAPSSTNTVPEPTGLLLAGAALALAWGARVRKT